TPKRFAARVPSRTAMPCAPRLPGLFRSTVLVLIVCAGSNRAAEAAAPPEPVIGVRDERRRIPQRLVTFTDALGRNLGRALAGDHADADALVQNVEHLDLRLERRASLRGAFAGDDLRRFVGELDQEARRALQPADPAARRIVEHRIRADGE